MSALVWLICALLAVSASYLSLRFLIKWAHLVPYAFNFFYMKLLVYQFVRRKQTAGDMFEERVASTPHALALIEEGSSLTFAQLEARASLFSHWALTCGLKQGDFVALMLDNSSDFVALWLGLCRIGITCSLLGTALRGSSLLHALKLSQSSLMVVGTECRSQLEEIWSDLEPRLQNAIFVHESEAQQMRARLESYSQNGFSPSHSSSPPAPRFATSAASSSSLSAALASSLSPTFNAAVSPASPSSSYSFASTSANSNASSPRFHHLPTLIARIAEQQLPLVNWKAYRQGMNSSSLLFLIYTSGTTGLSKAAKIRHSRFFLAGVSMSLFFSLSSKDRLYVTCPMSHAVGGVISPSISFFTGATLCLRRRFSATAFWRDCVQFEATVIVYIGQLCKYLINTPSTEFESRHQVQKALGNGMPLEIWSAFQSRFQVAQICEFYASTEGNCNLINSRNKEGAIGYIPYIASFIYPIRIVQYDFQTEMPVRDARGFCLDATYGELIGRITAGDPTRSFDGYTSHSASQSKILTSVFAKNDSWFRTGDLVRIDNDGYIFFMDRIGDTFRWKGENVSTTEVETVLAGFEALASVNVYGVVIEGHTGRCGMACITLKCSSSNSIPSPSSSAAAPLLSLTSPAPHFSSSSSNESTHSIAPLQVLDAQAWTRLYALVTKQLPSYAQPLFVRITPQMDVTATFKQRKVDLQKQGIDPSTIASAAPNDLIFFRDDAVRSFVPFTPQMYHSLLSGALRV